MVLETDIGIGAGVENVVVEIGKKIGMTIEDIDRV